MKIISTFPLVGCTRARRHRSSGGWDDTPGGGGGCCSNMVGIQPSFQIDWRSEEFSKPYALNFCSSLTNAREAAKARRTEAVMFETLLKILLETWRQPYSKMRTKPHPGCCQGGPLDVTTSIGRSRFVDRQHTPTRP